MRHKNMNPTAFASPIPAQGYNEITVTVVARPQDAARVGAFTAHNPTYSTPVRDLVKVFVTRYGFPTFNHHSLLRRGTAG